MTIGLLSLSSYAQELENATQIQPKHEIALWGAYGLSTLNYDLSIGDRTLGLGFLGGIGYNHYFNSHWSLGVGAEFSALSATSDLSKLKDYYPSFWRAPQGTTAFNVEVDAADFEQEYSVYYINVPVTVRYQLDAFKKHKFYVGGGVKVGIPFDGSYTSKGGFSSKGFNRAANGNNTGDAISGIHGLTSNQPIDYKDGAFDTELNVILDLETGIKWRLSNKVSLYTGVFVDYGLLDIRKEKTSDRAIAYTANPAGDFDKYVYSNPLTSVYAAGPGAKNTEVKNFTDRVNTLSAGLKIQLGFGFGKLHSKAAKSVTEAPKPLSAAEVDAIVARNAKHLIDAQKEEFQDIKDLLNALFKKEQKEVEEGYRLQTVWGFNLDKTDVVASMNSLLAENLQTLKSHPEIRVNLVGNTDDLGSKDYNRKLGLKRAEVIKAWLIDQGISNSRLTVSSNGSDSPFIPNTNEENRKYNRRVEFIIQK
jgi:outer membrane protein OmpA-like peptidoglycan-associated protein